jgi:hypothetical protein
MIGFLSKAEANMRLSEEQIARVLTGLETIELLSGSHSGPAQGMCAMEAVAFLATGEWTDMPPCIPYAVARLSQRCNDGFRNNADRTAWMRARAPYILRAESGADADRQRAYVAAEIAREVAVTALRARGRDTSAIDACATITDGASARAVRDALRNAAAYAAAYANAAAYAADAAADAYAAAAAYAAANAAADAADDAADDDDDDAADDDADDDDDDADARLKTNVRILDAWIGYVEVSQ